ncbi:sporulation protein YabP [Paenibacillus macquariensis subsp. defensor]|uniref:Sporulation protein YabP n=1 Tax=Paenibacillus macquariensis TaxID=948756 RepID=A0ABY1KCL3_9BACL|nr:sporulation protein YabP [Paenibacillus macquariensis]MEC0094126.1 sporulation protein YabP [Paenibacillus macquariensis]OAB26151.1 sporulation protein YabP [Paenibacillus macquariensis subsp. macquariensis]OAB33568.1 sporulation protein YabP [Paenibacillus macquariensis subsp. defensor]SIR60388.1 sporulation protein YabP [Paenibacillus macquariensis]
MIEQGKTKVHDLHMQNRRQIHMTGVINVESFDSEEFLLQTELGHLTIKGQNLHIKNLSLEDGLLSIDGLVHSLVYLDPGSHHSKNKGMLGKLFK